MRFLLTLAAGIGGYLWWRSRKDHESAVEGHIGALKSPPASGPGDDLTRIKGIGPKLAELLEDIGVRRFDQIAAWGDADIAAIDAQLGTFKGRIVRDDWIGQSKVLAGEVGAA